MKRYTWATALFLLAVFAFCCLFPLHGEQDRGFPFDYRLTEQEGLSNGEITCFLKDRAGFLWIGTSDGLNRFDGDSFTFFKNEPGNNSTLGHNIISSIVEDAGGLLWIATNGGGLDCLDRKTMQFTHYRHDENDKGSLINDTITAMVMDSRGELWIGTGTGLDRFPRKGKKFFHYSWEYRDKAALSCNIVKSLYIDNEGVLWAGTEEGLNRYNPDTDNFTRNVIARQTGFSGDIQMINAMYEDKNHNFWIGTHGGGLLCFDRQTGKYTKQYRNVPRNSTSLNGAVVYEINEDNRGNFWVGSWNGWNLFNPAKGTFTGYVFRGDWNDLYKNYITTIYNDDDGITWIGTAQGIIPLYPSRAGFKSYSTADAGLQPDSITAFCEDRNNGLWMATAGDGIKRVNRETGTIICYKHNVSAGGNLPDNRVRVLYAGRRGVIWAGTENGLAFYDEKADAFLPVQPESSPASPAAPPGFGSINILCEDENSGLWVATADRGLWRLKREKQGVKIFIPWLSGDTDNRLYAMCPAGAGGLWILTGAGLKWLNTATGETRHYPFADALLRDADRDHVIPLYEDSTGILWAGGRGLNRLDPVSERFDHFTLHRESAGDPVYGILEDNDHNLWISTEKGISRFNPAASRFTHFDRSHGLPVGSFNPGAFYSSSSGELFFGSTDGCCSFFPEDIDPDLLNAPGVVLTSFTQDGKAVPLPQFPEKTTAISLADEKNYFDFTFAADSPLYPRENQYAYKLEGYDSEWHYCGTIGRGLYRSLPVKDYTLRLKCSNRYGYWNGKITFLRIAVTPLVWRSWYMYIIYAVLGAVVLAVPVFIVITYRQSRQLKQKQLQLEQEKEVAESLRRLDKLKDEFLAATSHELRTPLNGMINLAESLLKTRTHDPEMKETLEVITASGKRLSNLINDILDFSRLKTGNLEIIRQPVNIKMLADFILMLTRVQAGHKNLVFINRVEDTLPRVLGDEERIQQILFNLVGNAVKFTESGTVEITATCDADKAVITVSDTGPGIPADKLEEIFEPFSQGPGSFRGTGLGLYITKQLVTLHGGDIQVDSAPGQGSRFSFSLPFCGDIIPAEEESRAPLLPSAGAPPRESYPHNGENSAETPTLLIIDDEPVNQYALAGQFAGEDYHLIHAYDGSEALQYMAGNRKIDLIILDLMLPGIDGFEVCRRIRSRYRPYELPIIMVTARNQAGDIANGLSVGANDYLARPFSRDELLARVRSQLNLARYDLMKEITEQKTNFFINLAHETRTPLTLIGNYLDGYIRKHGMDDELKGIKFYIEKLTEDIINFLDYEKLEKGQVFYDHHRVSNFSDITGQQLILFREAALRKNIILYSRVEPDLFVRADQAALERIINNIMDNAVKFTAAREDKQEKKIEVILERNNGQVLFAVSDNGIGIPADVQKHIFEKYYQVSHKKRSIQGNGMGLALTAVIIKSLQGEITVKSAPGKGSCFSVALTHHTPVPGEIVQPYALSSDISFYDVAVPAEENIRAGKFNILIVEDKIELTAYMHSRMKDKYNIYIARDGRTALEKLEKIPCPDIIISDIMMDEMDGYALFRSLSEKEQYRMIPFIIMTARGSLDEKLQSLYNGVMDYIYKPFLIDELLARIDSILRYEQMRKNFYERDKYAAFGILLSGISHELLNPLSGITGPIGNLRRYLDDSGKSGGESDEYLDMMDKNTKRISSLIKSLKSLYYQDEVKKEAIDFGKITHSLTELFSGKIKNRITIESLVKEDFHLTTNPSILSHILINLISNAIDSIPGRGIIRLFATRENGSTVIRVVDSGNGMSREVLDNVFNPFYTTKSDSKGLGLGLYIVKDLVMRMGWEIKIHSEPGKGSEFVILVKR